MSREEFKHFILAFGFKSNGLYYYYKEYKILLYPEFYTCYNGSEKIASCIDYNDFTPLYEFKRELRSIKLKKLLY